ncbi:MAG: cysteine desulfurase [Candidatus Aenigmarchaeota archaeon]|nr:cysteine desulfurase [Candidatus Aenigmarchaeota archaeon]
MKGIEKLKKDFPILKRKINGKNLVYLDSAATSQKPVQVIKAIKDYYENSNANVSRSVHKLGEEATEAYENARKTVAGLINANSEKEIVFVRNATEGINLVAYSYLLPLAPSGGKIISTVMEHHSNIVPWQFINSHGMDLEFADITKNFGINLKKLNGMVSKGTKLVTTTHASNVLGTINEVDKISKIAHDNGSLFLVDAAQSVPHMPVDVQKLDCDFLAFSGHKMLGPTGIGVLYAKEEHLESMKPFMYGGDMIKTVTLENTNFNDIPWKFEAGTPNVAGAVGLNAAVNYLKKIGLDKIRKHEIVLTKHALNEFSKLDNVSTYGPQDENKKGCVISFNVKGVHPHDVASLLDREGIATRSGHACAQPLMKRLGVKAVARASGYIYNDKGDIDSLIDGINKVKKTFGV